MATRLPQVNLVSTPICVQSFQTQSRVMPRLGSRVNLKATKIRATLKVYDRFQDAPGCEQLIIQLDDAYSSNHAFAHMMAFDLLTGKTALPKVPAQQRALMLWTLQNLRQNL